MQERTDDGTMMYSPNYTGYPGPHNYGYYPPNQLPAHIAPYSYNQGYRYPSPAGRQRRYADQFRAAP